MEVDFNLPEHRKYILNSIQPSMAHHQHTLLQEIFVMEMDYRRTDNDLDFFENIYQCAYLLFKIGDPSDVPRMWEAKNINFDMSCGFDIEALFGAGEKETLLHLETNDNRALAETLARYSLNEEDLRRWDEVKFDYFYSEIKEELMKLNLWIED